MGLIVCVFILVLIYMLSPYINGISYKIRFGSLDEWADYVSRDYSGKDASSYWNLRMFGEGVNNRDERLPFDTDVVFSSNEVYNIDKKFYIVGCYGVTNWLMRIGIYSRDDYTNESPVDSESIWKYKLICENSENSVYPKKYITMLCPTKSFFGYTSEAFIAAPQEIKNNEITLKIIYGENYSKVKKIRVKVKTKPIKPMLNNSSTANE